jgi:hypothetical protein
MLATIKNPIYHEAALITSGGKRTPRTNLYRPDMTPEIAIHPLSTFDVKFPRRVLKKISSIILSDAVAALSAIALVLAFSGYVVAYISSHHQHAHNYAMTPTKSVETRVVDRSSIMPMPGPGSAGNIKSAQGR